MKRLPAISLGVTLALIAAAEIVVHRAGPILKGRVEQTLRARFGGRVELESLDVSALQGLEVSGGGLRIYAPEGGQPIISVGHFSFHSSVIGLFYKPMHVATVRVNAMRVEIPPGGMHSAGRSRDKIEIQVDEVICDDSRLILGASNPGKDPKDFELRHIELHDVGPNAPWKYQAVLSNAIPRGDIHASGTFGPWRTDSPGESSVNGNYTFEHADLNTIKGLGGMLSSKGEFGGRLNRITVDGTTETPDFSLDTANHPMPLHTKFHAIIDGTTGDTYLQPVMARLASSSFRASGAVINIKGVGHKIDLAVDVPQGQLRDFLDLAVQTRPAIMTGIIATRVKLEIQPGKESVTHKLKLSGGFAVSAIHFTNPDVQDKVDMLSLRAQGDPKDAKPGAPDVNSGMKGTFGMSSGALRFPYLAYTLPGGRVNLEGVYSLDGQEFEFHGKVLTDASLSHLVASPVASLALKAISPFFKRKGGGAEIPISIGGTKSAPKFGLDLGGR